MKRKLLGRIKEICGTIAVFAERLGISRVSVSKKLNGKFPFTEKEIRKAIQILELEVSDIPAYFFM